MYDMNIRVFLEYLTEGSKGYKMLTSYHKGNLAVLKNRSSTFRYLIKGLIGTTDAKLNVTAVKYADILQVAVQPRAVGFKAE